MTTLGEPSVPGAATNTTQLCPQCVERLAEMPHIIGACASVGIEHGMTTVQTVQSYMRGVHRREGHR